MNTSTPSMYEMLVIIEEWKKDHYHDKLEIIFQNDKFKSNVRFRQNSLDKIAKNSKGFENLPETIEQPDEIWSTHKDGNVSRNYIKFGDKIAYVVQTENGIVENALLVTNVKKYRVGAWLI